MLLGLCVYQEPFLETLLLSNPFIGAPAEKRCSWWVNKYLLNCLNLRCLAVGVQTRSQGQRSRLGFQLHSTTSLWGPWGTQRQRHCFKRAPCRSVPSKPLSTCLLQALCRKGSLVYNLFVCLYIHTYTRLCINNIHTYIHPYIHTYIHNHLPTYLPPYLHTYIRIHTHTYAYTCIHAWIFQGPTAQVTIITALRPQCMGGKARHCRALAGLQQYHRQKAKEAVRKVRRSAWQPEQRPKVHK